MNRPDVTEAVDAIRERHNAAIAHRKPGTLDSRDDDIGLLLQLYDQQREMLARLAASPNS